MEQYELKAPIGKVVIRKDEPKSKTSSGIYLRLTDRPRSITGEVVSSSSTDYKQGDMIVFNPQVSSTINFNDENLVVIFDYDIAGKI